MASTHIELIHYASFVFVIFTFFLPQASCNTGNRTWVNSPCFVWGAFKTIVDPNQYLTTNETILQKGQTLGEAIEVCCDHPTFCTHQILSSVLDSSSEQVWEVKELAHMLWCEYDELVHRDCLPGDVCKVTIDAIGDIEVFCGCSECPTTDYATWSVTPSSATVTSTWQPTVKSLEGTTTAPDDGAQTITYVIIGAVVGGLVLVIATTTIAIIAVRRCNAKEETKGNKEPHRKDKQRNHRSDAKGPRYDEENPEYNADKPTHEMTQISRSRSNPGYTRDNGFEDTASEAHLSPPSSRSKHPSGGKSPKLATRLPNGSQLNDLNNPKSKKKHRHKHRSASSENNNNNNYKATSELYIHPPKESQYNEPFSPPVISDPKHYGNWNFTTVKYDNSSPGARRQPTEHSSDGYMEARPSTDAEGTIYETMDEETVGYDYIEAEAAEKSPAAPALPSRGH